MYLRILKKDFKRKKAIHLILVIFIFLATMFIAGSLNNLTVVLNGTEEFFDLAKVADYLMVTVGDADESTAFLGEMEEVERYEEDDILWTSGVNYELENGKQIELTSSTMLCPYNIKQQKFFDMENQEITHMEDGTIYLKKTVMDSNKDIAVGDSIFVITDNGYRKKFKVLGYAKDAFLGSDMMGTNRFIITSSDYDEIANEGGLAVGKIYSVWTNDLQAFNNAINKIDFSVVFNGDIDMIKMTYVMDMVIAAILLVVSLCLVIISALMLRFTILFTIDESLKEIGMMKAIGISDLSIRKLYMVKYLIMACVGGIFGFFASIPFSRSLLAQMTQNIVLNYTKNNILAQMIVSILLVFIVAMTAYVCTGRIKKMSPLDAIRSGGSGERFGKRGILKMAGFRGKATSFLAINDILCDWKKYIVLLFTGLIGVWIIVMPINTINTLSSENTCEWFSMQKCDFLVNAEGDMTHLIYEKDTLKIKQSLSDMKEVLEKNGIQVEKVFLECFYNIKIRHGENSYKAFACRAFGTDTKDYRYIEGDAPRYENEVALSHIVSEKIGAGIGDTVYFMKYGEKEEFIVTAIYQSMNNMGAVIRFPEEAKLDETAFSGTFSPQFILKEGEDHTLEEIEKVISEEYPGASVVSMTEYVDDMVGGIVEQVADFNVLLIAVVLLINVLVVVLMQRIFLVREFGVLGLLKALGFNDKAIIAWQTKRIALVLFAGILLGTVTGTAFSTLTSGQVFKMMGASKITFEIHPLEVYVIYPLVIFAVTVIACVITMGRVKKIRVQDINDSE